jgi:pyruvate formate lyase activating enzyme
MQPALFYEPLGDGTVECRLCMHYCRLRPGETGLCRVRHNRGGRLFTSSSGRPVLLGLEPIEKKYLFHAFPGSTTLSLGTAGCNLSCAYCINWRVSQSGTDAATPEVAPEEVVARALAGGARSIAFTYTEPTIFIEYAADIARCARRHGLAVVAKSNGIMAPDVLREMASWLDAINIDLKAWRNDEYRGTVGGDLGPVLANLRLAARLGLWLEVATLIVPGCSDAADDLAGMAQFIAMELGPETPWHLLRFYPHYQMLDRPVTSEAQLQQAVAAARSAGLRHVYTKELARGEMLHTVCPGCRAVVVRRQGYRVAAADLPGGCCGSCGRRLPGVGLEETR